MESDNLRQMVLDTALKAYRSGLVTGTSGNFSAREQSRLIITPSGRDYETMKPLDLVALDGEGRVLQGERKPSSEWRLHREVYNCRPDVGGVVHTHSPYATAFAVVNRALPPILVESALFLGGEVPIAPFARPGSQEVAEITVQALGTGAACLMASHGVLAVGKDLAEAYLNACYIEETARIYFMAKSLGVPKVFSAAEIAALCESRTN